MSLTLEIFIYILYFCLSNILRFLVNGDWTVWTEFTPLHQLGEIKRSRTCSNPPPKHGGAKCEGKAEEKRSMDNKDNIYMSYFSRFKR